MLKSLRYLLLVIVAAPSAAAAQVPDAASLAARLAYFSPQRAFLASSDGKAAEGRLSALQAATSKEVEARSAKLKALQTAFDAGAALLNDDARRAREQEIDRFQVDLQRFVEDAQAQFLGVRRDMENAFVAKLGPVLGAVAKERGLQMVLNEDAGVIAWADPALDITPDVVKRLNQP